ncbi:MAG: L,D-transpeptidase family protein, partial [Actinomycetota bacterium]|nr:L,D-transpeptidase family protein [Actinomycetota bacterium]
WRPAHRAALATIIEGVRARGLRVAGPESLRATHAVRWDTTLAAGSSGAQVRRLQESLRRRTYVPGSDGVFGEETLQAVYAFEKTQRLPRDGVVTPPDMERLLTSDRPVAPKRRADRFIDIDLSRQVLFEVEKGRVVQTLPVSSANGEYYFSDGERSKAVTPTGAFKVLWKIPGWRVSDLGELWYPSYFHSGGYAIHGSPLVPTYPASHGCVRVPMSVAKSLYSRLDIGTRVFVHN